jgi:isoamylase
MILAGDERSHSQKGNNNAYCQDNELTWLDWNLTDEQKELLEWTRNAVKILKTQPVLQRRHFFQGRPLRATGIKDVSFFEPSGDEMTDQSWSTPDLRCLGMRLSDDVEGGVRKTPEGDTLLILLNAQHEAVPFMLPKMLEAQEWESMLDSTDPKKKPARFQSESSYPLEGRSVALLRCAARVDAKAPASDHPAETAAH